MVVLGIHGRSLLLALQMSRCFLIVASKEAVFEDEKENTGGE